MRAALAMCVLPAAAGQGLADVRTGVCRLCASACTFTVVATELARNIQLVSPTPSPLVEPRSRLAPRRQT